MMATSCTACGKTSDSERSPFPISWRTGEFFFWLIIASMCVVPVTKTISVYGFQLQSLGWILSLLFGVGCLLWCPSRPITFPYQAFIPFCLYIIARTDFTDRIDAQRVLMMFAPVLCGMVASGLEYRDLRFVQRAYYLLFAFLALCTLQELLFYTIRIVKFLLVGTAMTYVLISIGALLCWRQTRWLSGAVYCACLGICAVAKMRLEAAVLAFLPFIIYLLEGSLFTVRKALWVLAVFMVFCAAFYTPPVQKNLFYSGHGTLWQSFVDVIHLDSSRLQTSGRLYIWKTNLDHIKNPWFGAGGAASYRFGMTYLNKEPHPHNEYIRVLFDYGIAGLVLLGWPLFHLFSIARRRLRTAAPDVRWAYSVTQIGLVVGLLIAMTDNVLVYAAFYGNLLFATAGAAFACTQKAQSAHEAAKPV